MLCLFAAVMDTASSSVGRGDLWHDYCTSVVSDVAGERQLFICGPHSYLLTRGSPHTFLLLTHWPATTNTLPSATRVTGFLADQNKAVDIVVHLLCVCVSLITKAVLAHRSFVGVRPVHVGPESCMASAPVADASTQDVCCGCASLLTVSYAMVEEQKTGCQLTGLCHSFSSCCPPWGRVIPSSGRELLKMVTVVLSD